VPIVALVWVSARWRRMLRGGVPQQGPESRCPRPLRRSDRAKCGGGICGFSYRTSFLSLSVHPSCRTGMPSTSYAELHCHSNFSFLDGASAVDELVDRAVGLGLSSPPLTSPGGLYG